MIAVTVSKDVPDGTYFTTTECEPVVTQEGVTVFTGNGKHRSWGSPSVTSTVVLNDSLLVVHVGFHHKHRGGQFWRYFMLAPENGIVQVKWADLDDETRQEILSAPRPIWANAPGKLRKDYVKGQMKVRTTYKVVGLRGDKMFSLYDGETEYVLGKRLCQSVENHHGGGFYSWPTLEDAQEMESDLAKHPHLYGFPWTPDDLVLLKCEISGRMIEYGNSKIASTYIKPVAIA